MPTQRDDAVYRSHYNALRHVMKGYDVATLRYRVAGVMCGAWDRSLPTYEAAKTDAATDILMERGLCSSVLSWHTRPATPPPTPPLPPEWDGEIPW